MSPSTQQQQQARQCLSHYPLSVRITVLSLSGLVSETAYHRVDDTATTLPPTCSVITVSFSSSPKNIPEPNDHPSLSIESRALPPVLRHLPYSTNNGADNNNNNNNRSTALWDYDESRPHVIFNIPSFHSDAMSSSTRQTPRNEKLPEIIELFISNEMKNNSSTNFSTRSSSTSIRSLNSSQQNQQQQQRQSHPLGVATLVVFEEEEIGVRDVELPVRRQQRRNRDDYSFDSFSTSEFGLDNNNNTTPLRRRLDHDAVLKIRVETTRTRPSTTTTTNNNNMETTSTTTKSQKDNMMATMATTNTCQTTTYPPRMSAFDVYERRQKLMRGGVLHTSSLTSLNSDGALTTTTPPHQRDHHHPLMTVMLCRSSASTGDNNDIVVPTTLKSTRRTTIVDILDDDYDCDHQQQQQLHDDDYFAYYDKTQPSFSEIESACKLDDLLKPKSDLSTGRTASMTLTSSDHDSVCSKGSQIPERQQQQQQQHQNNNNIINKMKKRHHEQVGVSLLCSSFRDVVDIFGSFVESMTHCEDHNMDAVAGVESMDSSIITEDFHGLVIEKSFQNEYYSSEY